MRDYVQSTSQRVKAARDIAEQLRHSPDLHRVAMNAVFVLEDCHESFVRIREAHSQTKVPLATTPLD